MEVAFRTPRLRTLCQEHGEAVKAFGQPAADVLQTRIADLRAATSLLDLPAGRPTVLDGESPQLRFPLRAGWTLSMAVGHRQVPRTAGGVLDQGRVRRARVEDISR